MDSLVQLQAGLAMNGIFEVLGENKKYIELAFHTVAARVPRAHTPSQKIHILSKCCPLQMCPGPPE